MVMPENTSASDFARIEEGAAKTCNASRLRRLASGVPILPALILTAFILCALFAGLLAPYPPEKISLGDRLSPPCFMAGGSRAHFLGTDALGRDIVSRIIFGARVSMIVSLLTILLAGGIGTTIGLIAGYLGGRTDAVLMRVIDTTLAFPGILIALLLAVALGPSFMTVLLALALIMWAFFARMVRGEVLTLKRAGFVDQARIMGASSARIIVTHLLPNVVNTLIVLATLQVGTVILVEASLSFLGAGVPPPAPSWGSMVADGRDLFNRAWWVSLFPGSAICLVVLSGNFIGDWLRDRLDPKLRQMQ
jgi:peptide/nickel transport system permease protein